VEFNCAAKTAQASGEEYYGRRNLKGGVDDAMPRVLTTPPPDPRGVVIPHPNFMSAPDFMPGPLWTAFGAKVCV
jgi:hypothetical protein